MLPTEETGPIPGSMVIEVALETFQCNVAVLPNGIVPGDV